jgi:uncharacterized membrane protein SirB2
MSSWYLVIKQVHMSCAALSVTFFFVRGGALLLGASWPRHPRSRRVADSVDGVLLLAAVVLMVMTRQYPGLTPWVTAKVVGLLMYIALGIAAFRFARNRGQRLAAWLGALCVAAYMVSVAISHRPEGFFLGVLW